MTRADPRRSPFPTLPVLDVPVSQVTYAELLRWVGERVEHARDPHNNRGRDGASSVVFANVHLVTEAHLHDDYRAAIWDAAVVAPDGMPLLWASRLQGSPLRERCYGPTFMERALHTSQTVGWRHYFYGAVSPTLERLQRESARRFPGARVAGAAEPPFGPLDDAVELAHIERINAAAPDLLWVGMGCPKQERWMQRYRRRLRAPVVLGVGAAFDFIAGVKVQAPAVLQGLGLEWAFRLGTEPGRLWRRYLKRNPLFLHEFFKQLRGRRPPRMPPSGS